MWIVKCVKQITIVLKYFDANEGKDIGNSMTSCVYGIKARFISAIIQFT